MDVTNEDEEIKAVLDEAMTAIIESLVKELPGGYIYKIRETGQFATIYSYCGNGTVCVKIVDPIPFFENQVVVGFRPEDLVKKGKIKR